MNRKIKIFPGVMALMLALSVMLGGCASPMENASDNVIYIYYLTISFITSSFFNM